MQLGVTNPILLSLRSNVDKLTSKKQLKSGWKAEINKIIETYGNCIETEVLLMMFEAIDWTVYIQNNITKEKGRIHMFSEIIKDLSLRPNFLDYFAEALEKTQKKKIILKNFDEIVKSLDLSQISKIAISLSMVLSADEAIKQKGVSYFKLRFREYFEIGKPMEIPEHLSTTVMRFIRTMDQLNVSPEEVTFWIESQKIFKNPDNQPLAFVGNPADAFSDSLTRVEPLNLQPSEVRGSLKDLLFELGPMAVQDTEIFKMLLADLGKVSEKEIILAINMMNENSPYVESAAGATKESVKLIRACFTSLMANDMSKLSGDIAEASQPTSWNYITFMKVIAETSKPNWLTVLKSLDSPSVYFSSKKSFTEFLTCYEVIKEAHKVTFPREMLVGTWENTRAQVSFLERFVELSKSEISLYKDIKNKNLIDYDTSPPVRNNPTFLSQGMDIWLFKDFVSRLIELSDSYYYNTIRSLFEMPMKKYPEILLATLAQVNPKKGHSLQEDILISLFPDLLDNPSSHTKIMEHISKSNFELMMHTFSEISRRDNNSLNLSRIIDICQNVKGSLQKLATSEEFEFSIPLGLFASRRELINLRTWLKERIDTSSEEFIEALIDYISMNIVVPATAIIQESMSGNVPQDKLDQILESSYLNANALNSIIEAWDQAASGREQLSERVTAKITEIRAELTRVLPENFSPANTTESEAEANKLFADVYEGRIDLRIFLSKLKDLKNSQKKQDEEILACVIHNLFQEYPHCNRQPKAAVELTGKIFGNLIKEKILHTMTTYKVCLQCIQDALKKRDRLFVLGISALNELKSMIHENLDICKNLFEIDQLRENHAPILWEILQNLRKTNNLAAIEPNYITEIEERYKSIQDATVLGQPSIQPSQPVNPEVQTPQSPVQQAQPQPPVQTQNAAAVERQNKESQGPVLISLREIENTSLQAEIRKRYLAECENLNISEEDKNATRFILNNLDRDKLEQRTRDLNNKLTTNDSLIWFSCYLVYDRVPTDRIYLDTYHELVSKINKKVMTKNVLWFTYILANLAFEYATYKRQLMTEELTSIRSIGHWVGLITLGCNKPIIKKDLDLKLKLYKSFENKSIRQTLPIVAAILNSVVASTVFKINNPYIMGILGILIEIKGEYNPRENVSVMIEQLFRDLKVTEESIKHFNFIQRRRNSKNSPNQTFMVMTLPESIIIDTRTLRNYTINQEIDLRQLVACAVDLSIRDITKPQIMQRSVGIALVTTKELILKDFAMEPDEEKLIRATESMIAKLAGNLALVTCTEPLKNSIKEYLDNFLEAQTTLPEESRKTIKDIATLDNLGLACNIVKKMVIDKALAELSKDRVIQNAIEKRRMARERNERFMDEKYLAVYRSLPNYVRPNSNGLTKDELQIYKNFAANDTTGGVGEYEVQPNPHRRGNSPRRIGGTPQNGGTTYPNQQGQPITTDTRRPPVDERVAPAIGHPANQQMPTAGRQLDEGRIRSLLDELEKHMRSPANIEEKMRAVHYIYASISRILQSTRDVEHHIIKLAVMLLELIFTPSLQAGDKLRYYSDILVIYSNYNPKLSKFITEWYFTNDVKTKYSHNILIVFLRRNLMHLVDFDTSYANVLDTVDQNNLQPLDCIVQVLKCLVIEQRIFAIYTFKKIVEKLIGFQRKRLFNSLQPDVAIFIENLADFMKTNNNYLSSIKFRLTNIEPEYKKLLTDVEDYFLKPDFAFYKQAIALLKRWLNAKSEVEMGAFIKAFEEEITRKGDKITISFFCYIIDVSCKQAERFYNASRKQVKLDYTYIDIVSKMVTILLKTMISNSPNNRINLLEKILTAVIIVLTKEHYYNVNNFNNKLFFKLLFNILYDLNWPEYGFQDNLKNMLLTIVQALHILQPIKYPGFSFAWLQLVSSKFLMAPLLRDEDKDVWAHFNSLILDLIIFYKEVFTSKCMQTPEMKQFYKGTLRLLLVLLHDFPDFLCHFSFSLLEEIPENFMQVKNIMVSAYPKGMRIPDPFEQENLGRIDMNEEYNRLPLINHKVEERISCHNLHNLITNCIKNQDQNDFDQIKKSFYISGYKNDMHINKMLLDSFVLYVPYLIYSLDTNDMNQIEGFKLDSYMLFIKLIKESEFELRDAIINSMLNNLRFPNQITFYFTHLILMIFTDVENDMIHEQIVRNLFERLIIEKPHPWGTLYLLDKLFTDKKYNFESKTFYKKNSVLMDKLISFVLDFVKISETGVQGDEDMALGN